MRFLCVTARSFLARYLDGELGDRLSRRIRSHLGVCEGCQRRAREAEFLRRRIMSFEAPHVREEEWDELWSTIDHRVNHDEGAITGGETVPFPRRHPRARYALVAAALTMLVGGAFARLWLAGNQPQQTSIASYIQYHENAVDSHVLLEDHFWSAQVLPVSYSTGK